MQSEVLCTTERIAENENSQDRRTQDGAVGEEVPQLLLYTSG